MKTRFRESFVGKVQITGKRLYEEEEVVRTVEIGSRKAVGVRALLKEEEVSRREWSE